MHRILYHFSRAYSIPPDALRFFHDHWFESSSNERIMMVCMVTQFHGTVVNLARIRLFADIGILTISIACFFT